MLPLKGWEIKLNNDLPGVGKKDEIFYYVRHHKGDMVVVTKVLDKLPEIMIPDASVRWEPGDNDVDNW